MVPHHSDDSITLHHGDCLDILPTLPDCSVDAVVCDPPYSLPGGFMGKTWDRHDSPSAFQAWCEKWARECLRVLKPGGMMLAFGGTRTVHRLTCGIEDAGFEIRDRIRCEMTGAVLPVELAWMQGQGFPKSLDVSKAIDKAGGDALAWRAFSTAYAAAVTSSTFTHADIDRHLGIASSSCYWARTDHRGGMPPRHHWNQVRDLLGLADDFVGLYDEAERERIGTRTTGRGTGRGTVAYIADGENDAITAPATDSARQWAGWGTALRPSYEPIVVARKPLAGTVAANVQAYGTGALNIASCRVSPAFPAHVGLVSAPLSPHGSPPGNEPVAPAPSRDVAARASLELDACSTDDTALDHVSETLHRNSDMEQEGGFAPSRGGRSDPLASAPEHERGYRRSPDSPAGYRPSPCSDDGHALSEGAGDLASRQLLPDAVEPRDPRARPPHSRSDPSMPYRNGTAPDVEGAGRWPSNVVLSHAPAPDGSDGCEGGCVQGCPVRALDAQSGVLHSQNPETRKSRSKLQGATGFGTGASIEYADSGGASRFFPTFRYQAKAPTRERPKVDGIAHPTCKPLTLMRFLVRLVTPPGGVILDPFAGSGTTAEACLLEGFRCIAIEREADYLPLIRARLDRNPQAVLL